MMLSNATLLFTPSFHHGAHNQVNTNSASVEMAQRPWSAITVSNLGLMYRVLLPGYKGRASEQKPLTGPSTRGSTRVRGGGEMDDSNLTCGSVTWSQCTALLAREETLTQHLISSFIPQCTLLFPLRCGCDMAHAASYMASIAQRWRSSMSSSSSSFLAFRGDKGQKWMEEGIPINWSHSDRLNWYLILNDKYHHNLVFLKKTRKGCAFLREDINQIISLLMTHNPLQYPLATACHNSRKKKKSSLQSHCQKKKGTDCCVRLLPGLEGNEVEGTLGRLSEPPISSRLLSTSSCCSSSSSASSSSLSDKHTPI